MSVRSLQKTLLFCMITAIIMMFFISCETNEQKEKKLVRASYRSFEECMNTKDATAFKAMFNSVGQASLNDSVIDQLFAMFPSGITLNQTPYDDYFSVSYWLNDNFTDRHISWSREIVDNSTGETFHISVYQYTTESPGEDIGIIRLIVYPIEKEDEFDIWWDEINVDDPPNGLIIYKTES